MFRRISISRQSDEEVLRRYRDSGNTEYFGKLYNRYIPLLYGIALKYLNDTESAENAVMQLFENLLENITQYDIPNFRTWIFSVMKNHCSQILQKKDSREIITDFDTETTETEERDEFLDLFDKSDNNKEKQEQLKSSIKKLPVEQRITIIRFFIEEMSFADISDTTEYSLKQVQNYIQDGIRNLKNYIETNS